MERRFILVSHSMLGGNLAAEWGEVGMGCRAWLWLEGHPLGGMWVGLSGLLLSSSPLASPL